MIGPPRRLERILCAIDGSRGAEEAVHQALRLATADDARVSFVVVEPGEDTGEGWAPTEMQARLALELALGQAHRSGVDGEAIILRGPSVSEAIARRAPAFDIVVLAARRRQGRGRPEIGEVSKRVAAKAEPPVLIARRAHAGARAVSALQVLRDPRPTGSFGERLDDIGRSEPGSLLVAVG